MLSLFTPHLSRHCTQESKEPEIYRAIRFGTVLENVVFDRRTRVVDFAAWVVCVCVCARVRCMCVCLCVCMEQATSQ